MTRRAFADERRASWDDDPTRGGVLHGLLPPAVASHPNVLFARGGAPLITPSEAAETREVIRARRLFWPAPRFNAVAAPVVVDLAHARPRLGASLLDAVLAREPIGEVAVVAEGRMGRLAAARGFRVVPGLAHAAPDALRAVYGPAGVAAPCWAALGGVRPFWIDGGGVRAMNPEPWLLRATAFDPWRRRPVSIAEALEALAFLRREASRNARPRATVGMSGWKRRNIAPFLVGPCGAPQHFRSAEAARRAVGAEGRLVVWGDRRAPAGRVERAEDGFIRSVGLGVRHAPPSSLAIGPGGLHFEAEGINDFVRVALDSEFTPELLARAARLRDTVIRARITKYNLGAAEPPPAPDGRLRLLVPGQVEGDASLTHGAPGLKTNAALIAAARARHPEAFLLYKPHPDVVTGLRRGHVPAETLALTDAVAPHVSAEACLDWAEKVETMTSLMGFEALMRGRAVATHGRPFYTGWGLTEDLSGLPPRGALTLDALVAAALILYPRYVDPVSGLPAPPEVVIEALVQERRAGASPKYLFRALRRRVASSVSNAIG